MPPETTLLGDDRLLGASRGTCVFSVSWELLPLSVRAGDRGPAAPPVTGAFVGVTRARLPCSWGFSPCVLAPGFQGGT